MIDWHVPGYELRDNPVVRQAPPGRVKAGEERRHATGDPSLLMPGDIKQEPSLLITFCSVFLVKDRIGDLMHFN